MASGSLSYWDVRETGPREAMTALFTVPKERFFSKKHIKFLKKFSWLFSGETSLQELIVVFVTQFYVISMFYVSLM